MKNIVHWFLWHALHWAVLYGAFLAELEGAMYLLKFFVWLLAPLSLFLLTSTAVVSLAKRPPQPLRYALSRLQAWVTLGLLVWFGHIATGVAWGLVMFVVAAATSATRKVRESAATGPA